MPSGTDIRCTGNLPTQTDASTFFNGLNAKGTFVFAHTLVGGVYPAAGGGTMDALQVTYTTP